MGSLTVYLFLILINPLCFLYTIVRLIQYQLEIRTVEDNNQALPLIRQRRKFVIAFFISATILCFSIVLIVRISNIQW
jgi:hypothetical protein